ncbi:MAG: acetylornithine deacetylase [Hyphomonadaceae bacterium]|nr:acetylornithine deacetylase [Hyphomonadaceae bacterium]
MSEISATLDILTRLIAFDTTSRNSNLELIAWVEDFLRQRGIASRRVANADGTKANLYASIGPDVAGGVVLSGHTDVVPVDGQSWTSDPWLLSERDGKLYGRGTADMKAFIALALANLDEARTAPLKRPMVLAFSYDEEIGCLGAPSMIAELVAQTHRPSAVVVGEPTSMKVVSAHKGVRSFIVDVTGREGHSSLPDQGVSAVMEAVKLMSLVAEMGEEARALTHPHFNPPGPTMTIGKVDGGTASNILARRCSFVWDCRCPETTQGDAIESRFRAVAAEIDASIKKRAPEGGVAITRRTNTPGLAIERDSEAERLARALTGDNETRTVAYAAEAGLFQRAGIPAIICGPGSIEQAHQPDEWIERAQLEEGAQFMRRLIARLSA